MESLRWLQKRQVSTGIARLVSVFSRVGCESVAPAWSLEGVSSGKGSVVSPDSASSAICMQKRSAKYHIVNNKLMRYVECKDMRFSIRTNKRTCGGCGGRLGGLFGFC